MELIWFLPESFIMGPGGGNSSSYPVILTKGFYLGKYEVTQEQYEQVMKVNPSEFTGSKLPVESVTWHETVAFFESLNKKEGIGGWTFQLKPSGSMPEGPEHQHTTVGGTLLV